MNMFSKKDDNDSEDDDYKPVGLVVGSAMKEDLEAKRKQKK